VYYTSISAEIAIVVIQQRRLHRQPKVTGGLLNTLGLGRYDHSRRLRESKFARDRVARRQQALEGTLNVIGIVVGEGLSCPSGHNVAN